MIYNGEITYDKAVEIGLIPLLSSNEIAQAMEDRLEHVFKGSKSREKGGRISWSMDAQIRVISNVNDLKGI